MAAGRVRVDALAVVAAGGALGSVGRYGLEQAWSSPPTAFPWVTLLINVAGCAAIGVVMEVLAGRSVPHRLARPFLGTGLLGGFTTFSMYAVQTQQLLAAGRGGVAAAYLTTTLFGAVVAVWVGMVMVRAVIGPRVDERAPSDEPAPRDEVVRYAGRQP